MDAAGLACEMLDECLRDGQAARTVGADADAAALRQQLRQVARARQLRIRTARMDRAVVVVRTDADIWHEDAATMRRKLTPR